MPFLPLPPRTVARGGGRGLLVNSIHGVDTLRYVVVLYRLSTSNHNGSPVVVIDKELSYIVFLHQTTTFPRPILLRQYCLISSFYIKPQQPAKWHKNICIVLYRLSTSNHNSSVQLMLLNLIVLYCLSTSNHNLAKFQPKKQSIVLYCLSTSNHNSASYRLKYPTIVLYCLSTSNHNMSMEQSTWLMIVLYCLSTSNHNSLERLQCAHRLSYIVFLHQTTTYSVPCYSNHLLSYIVFLHQTTTPITPDFTDWKLSYIVFLHQTTTLLIYSSDSQSV